jgi:inhibitor of KinA
LAIFTPQSSASLEFLQDDKGFRIYAISEYAITLEWPKADASEEVLKYAGALALKNIEGIEEWVPAYNTLTIFYQPAQRGFNELKSILHEIESSSEVHFTPAVSNRLVTIPVCYGGNYGPDLEAAAASKGFSKEAFIDIHTSGTYKVFMLGFLPGFPYMGWVDERISLPRLEQPRREVLAGSVGIAGLQTGIYPMNCPGGWPIIGRTPLKIFEVNQTRPCLLEPGDQVRFLSIPPEAFEQYPL